MVESASMAVFVLFVILVGKFVEQGLSGHSQIPAHLENVTFLETNSSVHVFTFNQSGKNNKDGQLEVPSYVNNIETEDDSDGEYVVPSDKIRTLGEDNSPGFSPEDLPGHFWEYEPVVEVVDSRPKYGPNAYTPYGHMTDYERDFHRETDNPRYHDGHDYSNSAPREAEFSAHAQIRDDVPRARNTIWDSLVASVIPQSLLGPRAKIVTDAANVTHSNTTDATNVTKGGSTGNMVDFAWGHDPRLLVNDSVEFVAAPRLSDPGPGHNFIRALTRVRFTWVDILITVCCTAAILLVLVNMGVLLQYCLQRSGRHCKQFSPHIPIPPCDHTMRYKVDTLHFSSATKKRRLRKLNRHRRPLSTKSDSSDTSGLSVTSVGTQYENMDAMIASFISNDLIVELNDRDSACTSVSDGFTFSRDYGVPQPFNDGATDL